MSSRTIWFQYCVDSNNKLFYVRDFQGVMNHVAISLRWKEFVYHVRISFSVNSILQAKIIVSGEDTQAGRQTVFFTPLDTLGGETEEENDDLSKPRKVPCRSKCLPTGFLF